MNSTEEKLPEARVPLENYISFDRASPDYSPTAVDPDAPHWNVAAGLGIFALSVALLIVVQFIVIGGYIAIKSSLGGAALADAQGAPKDATVIVLALASVLPVHLLTILAIWLLVTKRGRQSFWQTIGWDFRRFYGYGGFLICFLVTIGLYAMGIAIISQTGEQENDLQRILQSSSAAVYLTAFLATFTAPLVEELVYRGVLYPAFRSKFGAGAAILFVSLLFAGVHVPQYVEPDKLQNVSNYGTISVILLLSFVLTAIRATTKSLLPSFVIHTIFNGIQSLALVLAQFFPKIFAPDEPVTSLLWRLFHF